MDEGYYMALAKVRMDRAEELLIEAKDLLEKSYERKDEVIEILPGQIGFNI